MRASLITYWAWMHLLATSLCMHVVCVHACIYVCMYACMYVCMYVCMLYVLCMYVCMCVCVCVCVYVCTYVCMYVCMYACLTLWACFGVFTCSIYSSGLANVALRQETHVVKSTSTLARLALGTRAAGPL